ncbi:monoheme cytochrome C [Flagellimonas sp. DF-77]|uniref:monoheme cytochrome C n=1 Tax=Flagellimonas algarum TaxID=3230298 RepID=UPI003397F11E
MKTDLEKHIPHLIRALALFSVMVLVVFGGLLYLKNTPPATKDITLDVIEPDTTIVLDESTIASSGLVNDQHVSLVIQHCTACHSAKLVTQNRLNAAGWDATISWMQQTQNLWELGTAREKIVAYLSKNYSPTAKGRRANLSTPEWYELN